MNFNNMQYIKTYEIYKYYKKYNSEKKHHVDKISTMNLEEYYQAAFKEYCSDQPDDFYSTVNNFIEDMEDDDIRLYCKDNYMVVMK